MEHDIRPWGEYFVLDNSLTQKVKRIVVKPQQRLSYQYHKFRSEIWVITSGEAIVTINYVDTLFKVGEVVTIPVGAKHRVQNNALEDLIFIEVQLGNYFGEDDIIRIADDYQRA